MRNLQEQVKKAFCYQKLFWPFTVRINCSSDLKSFSRSLEQFFLTVGQKNFGNKIPIFVILFLNFSEKKIKKNTLELCWRLKIRKAAQCILVHFFASTHKIGIFRIPIHVGQALVSLGVNQALSHHSSHGRPQRWEIMEQLEKQVSGLDHLKKIKPCL